MPPASVASRRFASRDVASVHRGRTVLAVLAVLAMTLAVTGCSPTASPSAPAPASPQPATAESSGIVPGSSPESSVDAASTYALIAGQVEQIRGLTPKEAVAPTLIDESQLRSNLTADFDENNPPAAVELTQDLYVELGLLPAGTSLRDAYLALQAGQVAGYYSPEKKQLFVVSRAGGVGATQRVTYAHEFTHQLQDQNFDLSKLGLSTTDQTDRAVARLALVEGDAVSTQTAWMTAHLTTSDFAEVLRDATDPAAIAALEQAPAVLRATTLFPYTDGLTFVSSLKALGGETAVNAAFANPPASTAQVIHPELYASHLAPVAIKLPTDLAARLGPGWQLLGEDTLGELGLRVWLSGDGVDSTVAATAASGWSGDRIAVLAGPNGQLAVVIVARWTTSADRDEFAAAYARVSSRLPGVPSFDGTLGENTTAIVIAPSQALGQALRTDVER
jgi:hypothetical protein